VMPRAVPAHPSWLAQRHGLGKEVAATVSRMTAELPAVAKAATESQ
jgi:hypothetical protein